MNETLLLRIDAERNMRRFYAVRVEPTLFGETSVIKSWGRIGTRGREMCETHDTEVEAATAAARQIDRKVRRGYHPMDPD